MQNEQLAEQIQEAQLQRDDLADQAPPAERRVTPETVIKRKRLKRQREPTAITATSSEKAILGEKNLERRNRETYEKAQLIHGATEGDKSPALDGLWLALISNCSDIKLKTYLEKSKTIKKILKTSHEDDISNYEKSNENKIRSLSVFYSSGLVSKEKYKQIRQDLIYETKGKNAKRRAKRRVTAKGIKIPALLSWPKLLNFIRSINTGELKDVKDDFCSDLEDDDKVEGKYRDLKDLLINLAEFYLNLNDLNAIKLLWFTGRKYVFEVAVGADGAPFGKDDEATAFLVSFVNVGTRVASCNDNFLAFGANCHETHPAAVKFAKKLLADITYIEGKSFSVLGNDVSFNFSLVPADLKWIASFSGELNNAAFYFSSFANVNNDNKFIMNGTLGREDGCTWKPWNYQGRLEDAGKVDQFKKTLKPTLAEKTKRSKVLEKMKSLKTRQEFKPIIGTLVDSAYIENLHSTNNAWHQWYSDLVLEALTLTRPIMPEGCKSIDDLPLDAPLRKLTVALFKNVKARRVYRKLKKWFSDGAKQDVRQSYRFTGKESKLFSKYFMYLIQSLLSCNLDHHQKLRINVYYYIGLQLRQLSSLMARIVDIPDDYIDDLKSRCKKYFNAYSLFVNKVSPTVWHIGYAAPYHAKIIKDKFSLGLGINTMQGREAKHIQIAKFASHAHADQRWEKVFQHEYISLIWLRNSDPFSAHYNHSDSSFLPQGLDNVDTCFCGLKKDPAAVSCDICSQEQIRQIDDSVESGHMVDEIKCLLSSLQE